MGIHSVQDLLFYLPRRYVDRTRVTPLASLRNNTAAVIQGRVIDAKLVFGRRRSLAVNIEDDSGTTCLRFFHFNASQKNQFEPGRQLRCFGEARLGASGLEFYHPEYEFTDTGATALQEASLTPVYRLTEGLSQARLRKLTQQAITQLAAHSPRDLLPLSVNQQFGVSSLGEALRFLHFPPPDAPTESMLSGQHPCQLRLAFEELLAHFLVRRQLRAKTHAFAAPEIVAIAPQRTALLDALPFKLTAAQQRVIAEIYQDLKQGSPMLRMVQGDVGSGKTLVAAIAALDVVNAGYQVAVVAPTEILAEQHRQNFLLWFRPLGIEVVWLAGKIKPAERRQTLAVIASGQAQIVVGTHALFQEDVNFAALGLAVVDEQHRFGVDQRLSLRQVNNHGQIPHQLVMTATPIPRTLAMTAYSELDYSVIDELPPGRTPISTALVSQKRRQQVIARMQHACNQGTQAYWVCPLVEDSETLSVANAESTYKDLQAALPKCPVGLVHGRLKPAEKEATMLAFKAGEIQILVATTVIEVGVDVANASLMIIENPERLGLAQLHQLRGRVGRGSVASHCLLLYGDKLSNQAKQRLQVLRDSTDGFVIAEKDLQLRGPGELMGTRQTGDMQYTVADIQQHGHLIPLVHEIGHPLFDAEPEVRNRLIKRWIGHRQDYASV